MEERIGKRINTERIDEALALGPDTISTACPYCLVARRRGSRQEGIRPGQGQPRGHRRGATPGPFGRAKERRQRQ